MHLTNKQLFKLAPLLIGVAFVIAMLIFINLNRASVYNELFALDLIPKPEKLTELYFNDNANLPASVTSNQAVSFAFVIHNLETTDYQYTYDVFVNANGMKQIVNSSKVLVKDNQYYVKKEQFKLTKLTGRQKVVVELTNKQQSIDFWIGE
jgi:hypothetical protein